MPPRIALLIDADQWPAPGLASVVAEAWRQGSIVAQDAFGAFADPKLSVWRKHFDLLEFRLHTAVGRNAADDLLLERARSLVATADEVWVATKDRRLLERLADELGEQTEIVVVEDPTFPPRNLRLVKPPRRKLEIPPEVRAILLDAVERSLRHDGYAFLSQVIDRSRQVDPLEYGRSTMFELLKDMRAELLVEEDASGGAVRVRLRHR